MNSNTYSVLTPIDHDGIRYEPDSRIELTDRQAAPLLAAEAIGPVTEEQPQPAEAPAEAAATDDQPKDKKASK